MKQHKGLGSKDLNKLFNRKHFTFLFVVLWITEWLDCGDLYIELVKTFTVLMLC